MTYIPAPDHKTAFSRLDDMVVGLTGAVVSVYAAIAEIAAATDNQELRNSLNKTTDEISHRLDEIIAAMKRNDKTQP